MDSEKDRTEDNQMELQIPELDYEGLPYRNVKDSVFRSLFSDPVNLLELYQTLHPEDKESTVNDLSIVTLETVIIKDIHNDIGFMVGDKMVILAEAQSHWSDNILIRGLMYMAKTYQNYFRDTEQSLYSTKRVHMPKP
ncbi:MAG: hypothetical protein LIP11_12935 [Clostridiales bacterium]|nr:hypothetical protein [Clostridiales bacterium]